MTRRPPWPDVARTRWRTGLAACMAGAALAWAAGLAWFTHDAMRPAVPPPHADGLVALTGGQGRIEESLRLMVHGHAGRLLISGVDPHATRGDFLRRLPTPVPVEVWTRTMLGTRATSTLGNADETAAWVQEYGLHSLIVVTAGYHIRRAMLEISRAVPGVRLYGYPIRSPVLSHPLHPATIRLMVVEYDKWLLACMDMVRLTRPLHALVNHTDTRPDTTGSPG